MDNNFEFENLGVPPSPLRMAKNEIHEQRVLAFRNNPIVIAPYAKTYQEHIEALQRLEYSAVRVGCPERTDYFWLMHDAWIAALSGGKSIVIIEHDIVPKPGQLQALLACDHAWCGYPYTISTQYRACMGFTCYSKELIQAHPNAFEWIGDLTADFDGCPQRDYLRLDTRIDSYFEQFGYTQHTHWPPVAHLNPQQHLQVELDRGWCAYPPRNLP